jgi:CheY-like chemotaxis protein
VKDCKEIPDKPKIILETGFEVDEATIKSLETLIDYFLFKPVSKSQLFDAVMTVFGLDKSKRNRIEPAGEELPEGIKRIRGARILLVEDNAINQEVACEIIQAEGFNVSLADDGLQALMKIRETAAGGGYDAVLMDLQMPEMDGYEATREIRKDHRFLNLPIIAMTAEALAGVSERVMAVGMNDYVTKPITPRLLFESLVRWIEPGDRAPFDSGNAVGEAKAMGAELPEAMNGINIASGLNRMRGNREKYHALLLKFSNNHGEILSEIRKALKKKNPDTAVRLAHNLRGVSGNIGADKLAAAARDLEAGIKKKQRKNLNLLLQSAERELGAVLASIRQVAGVGAEPSGAQRKGEADMEKAAATARSLKQLIETFDTRALDEFAVLKDILIGAPIAEELAVMERLLGRYEFNDAMSMLEDIMKKLQLDDTTASPGVSDNA